MKTYSIVIDDFAKEVILNALMEKAHASNYKVRQNCLQVYGDIQEQLD